ncbi:DUF6053 domain-containing protein [Lysobacter yananisis]|uniref:DUF6053 domain-containing protein n=1 Tax=Lysobacter yananisis TaxID=1003114 RepID=UPI003CE5AE36
MGFAVAEEASASASWVRFAAVCDESVGTEVPPTKRARPAGRECADKAAAPATAAIMRAAALRIPDPP